MYIHKKRRKKGIILALSIFIVVFSILFLIFTRQTKNDLIDRITVSKEPAKTQYYIGESEKFEDIIIEVVMKNGKSNFINGSDCNFEGFDSSKTAERQIITVTYNGFSCTFSISIIDYPKAEPVLQSIYLETLPKTQYKIGETLDTTGGVIVREYKDGSSARINLVNSYVYGFTSDEVGTYTLTVIYIENGLMAETTYEIIVSE